MKPRDEYTDAGSCEEMTQEEIRIRSLYLFLACSQAVDEFKGKLEASFPELPLSSQLLLDKVLKRELGMLFRYWATRKIWDRLDAHEADAKALNVALLRLFTEGFRLPRDGSGLRYAELSTPSEEMQELRHRLTDALGMERPPLFDALLGGIGLWRDTVLGYTGEALERPINELLSQVQRWTAQSHEVRP